MPFFTQTLCMGRLHHAIEYRDKPRVRRECLGTVQERLRISDQEAAQGIDPLVRANFPEAFEPKEPPYYGF